MGGQPTDTEATGGPASTSGPSRLVAVLVALATVTVFIPTAIANPGGWDANVASDENPATTMPGRDVTDAEPTPLIEHVDEEFLDSMTILDDASHPMAFPPTLEPTIRPGRQIVIDIPQSGASLCTMNFIYQVDDVSDYTPEPNQPDLEQGDYLIGTAGHCVLPADTHTSQASDYTSPNVEVCVYLCAGSQASGQAGAYYSMGQVLYARQEVNGVQLGEDYAFVKVPERHEDILEPQVPVWSGPSDSTEPVFGDSLATYGQGTGYGDAELDARLGVTLPLIVQGSNGAFLGVLPSAPGDSGGPILSHVDALPPNGPDARAVGDLTHLVAGATAGTLSDHAISFTYQSTGAQLSLVTASGQIAS